MGEPYEVQIKTTADPAGAQETEASLDRVGDKAAALNERDVALASQKEALTAKQLAALQAEALGETEVAATLQREVTIRAAALRLQQQSNISEAEAVAIARARSVEEDKVYGKAGKFKLLQNLGVDSDTAKTLGIAAFAGFQLQQWIGEAAKYYDNLRIEAEKESVELEKQVQGWREMAAAAKDLNDVAKLNESITKTVAESYEKLKTLPSEGTGGFWQNLTDATTLYDQSLRRLLGMQQQYGTSTEEAARKQKDLINSQEQADRVYTGSATAHAEAIRALLALPYADAVEKARAEITRLSGEQENLNRSDTKQEQSWQRKQSQINALSSAIAQLADRHELLTRKEQLEAQVAIATDPEKRAAAQKELDDLRAKLLIQDQIQKASAKAALDNKALSDGDRKAIEDQLKPLQAKLELLRKLAELNPSGGYQKQIDTLLNVKPANATDSAKLFYEKVVNDAKSTAGEIQNAKANLELILQQELRSIAKTTAPNRPPPPGPEKLPSGLKPYSDADSVSQGVEEIGRSVADGTGKLRAAIDGSVAQIKPAFDPVAEAIRTQIPQAVAAGTEQLVQAVAESANSSKAALTKAVQDLKQQIAAIWQAI